MPSEQELAPSRKLAEPLLQLQKEHESILQEGTRIVAAAKQVNPGTQGERVRAVILAIRQLRTLLVDHESKEEQILTPMIDKLLDSEAGATMKKEHTHICRLLQDLERALEQDVGTRRNQQNIIDLVAQFDSSIRAHFSREENVLFWLVSLHMSKSD